MFAVVTFMFVQALLWQHDRQLAASAADRAATAVALVRVVTGRRPSRRGGRPAAAGLRDVSVSITRGVDETVVVVCGDGPGILIGTSSTVSARSVTPTERFQTRDRRCVERGRDCRGERRRGGDDVHRPVDRSGWCCCSCSSAAKAPPPRASPTPPTSRRSRPRSNAAPAPPRRRPRRPRRRRCRRPARPVPAGRRDGVGGPVGARRGHHRHGDLLGRHRRPRRHRRAARQLIGSSRAVIDTLPTYDRDRPP